MVAAATHARSIPILVILVGVAAFGLGVATIFFRAPTPGVRAQAIAPSDCAQPNEEGCWISLEVPTQASPNDPTVAHNWLVDIPEGTDFFVAVANLPADLQVLVYGPDDSLLHQSNRPGYLDEIVHVANVGAGTYWIVIDSPAGDSSDEPYTLLATTATLTVEQSVDPYRNPNEFFLPY